MSQKPGKVDSIIMFKGEKVRLEVRELQGGLEAQETVEQKEAVCIWAT